MNKYYVIRFSGTEMVHYDDESKELKEAEDLAKEWAKEHPEDHVEVVERKCAFSVEYSIKRTDF